ncbi:acyl-ACP desaturase [Roseospira visakhapatnamensis]|uniref:Rubrerythrin n=1 Tax=Roseospira visakhapatnamensis TaxID=390880 RepID=A0A7W6RE33_9PROT|nr:ferritin-like domain-containing protein [Roseospira visakhapatnamensis]MBB4266860.1 rubrerythrin [Roseospira visakhapatnamensis]
MSVWTLDDIPWDAFDPTRVDAEMLRIIKAAALTERNSAQYALYLRNVFHDDPAFGAAVDLWAEEETRHGDALGRWAERADPGFDFQATFRRFVEGYVIPTDVSQSVRGSRTGEMVARCIVETGTSSFYSALRDAAEEPVLKDICRRIAGDEFRHYKLFYTTLQTTLARENVSRGRRLLVALSRMQETEDDELAFAYHCANTPDRPYDRATSARAYAARAFSRYRLTHVERGSAMALKAAGLNPQGRLGRLASGALWRYLRFRLWRMADEVRAGRARPGHSMAA